MTGINIARVKLRGGGGELECGRIGHRMVGYDRIEYGRYGKTGSGYGGDEYDGGW